MTAPPGDRGQLDFLQHVQRIFDEGEFVATWLGNRGQSPIQGAG